jgi:DNA-directed RNA polymerase subunit beta
VLLKEMQSLALDVNVVSEEGQRAEMADEDDDLLRAAEELGIDLSGVRAGEAPAVEAADEAVEGTDDTDTSDGTEAVAEETVEEAPDLGVDGEIDLGELPEDVAPVVVDDEA